MVHLVKVLSELKRYTHTQGWTIGRMDGHLSLMIPSARPAADNTSYDWAIGKSLTDYKGQLE